MMLAEPPVTYDDLKPTSIAEAHYILRRAWDYPDSRVDAAVDYAYTHESYKETEHVRMTTIPPPSAGSFLSGFLDVVGLIPIVGDGVDLMRCAFDHGMDAVDRGLTCASAIPIAGTFAVGAKGGRRVFHMIHDGEKLAEEGQDGLKATSSGWSLGDDINAPTRAGRSPAWSTVRARYWKNAATGEDAATIYGEQGIARMRRGLAPQRANPAAPGGIESKELSHEPIPRRAGGTAVVERWPCDHAVVDNFRHPGYC